MSEAVSNAIAALEQLAPLNPLVRVPVEIAGAADGPLAGVPVVVKANIAIQGLPHCGASPALADHIAQAHAPVVERLLGAGAVIVGQANMHELAFGITSHNAHTGPVGNPAAPGHMAGGSSGGTAAAVAGGAVPMGLATDTGGSGRAPAAMCGCVGFRPSHGRYPGHGVLNLSESFDTVAPMGRDVSAVRRLDAVLADDGAALAAAAPGNIRIGMVAALWSGVNRTMAEACRAVVSRLETVSAVTSPAAAPDLIERCGEIAMGIVLYETRRIWEPFTSARGETLAGFAAQIASPDVAGIFRMIDEGAAPPEDSYAEMAGPKRKAVRALLGEAMRGVDVLAMPTLPVSAPPLGATETCQIDGEETDLFTAITRRELLASVTGYPAITLPAGWHAGLPFGLELIGKPGQDAALLAIAAALEPALST